MKNIYLIIVLIFTFTLCIFNVLTTPELDSAPNRDYVPGIYDDDNWSQYQDPKDNQDKIIPSQKEKSKKEDKDNKNEKQNKTPSSFNKEK